MELLAESHRLLKHWNQISTSLDISHYLIHRLALIYQWPSNSDMHIHCSLFSQHSLLREFGFVYRSRPYTN